MHVNDWRRVVIEYAVDDTTRESESEREREKRQNIEVEAEGEEEKTKRIREWKPMRRST